MPEPVPQASITTGRPVKLHPSWQALLAAEFSEPYMRSLSTFLRQQKQQGKRVYPPGELIFNAFNSTPVDQVKVVIIGQDPYHGAGQAHGLSFSVPAGVPLPPSLKNIYAEVASDLQLQPNFHQGQGDLSAWSAQGVLLLNAVLTVEHAQAASHQGKGWERFTDAAVNALAAERDGLVFLLWGSYAQRKGQLLDRARHCVLSAPHPSPLSAHRGFLGCRHFSRANAYLQGQGVAPVDWARLA